MPLDMHIIVGGDAVPGFPGYGQQHDAILEFDKDSKKEIEVENHQLTSLDGNKNGPEVKEDESENQGSLIENPDKTEERNYQSDIELERHFNNPVKLLEKDGKKYIQMTGNNGQFIDSLTIDRKSTRLNSSHVAISYAVFCLKKKTILLYIHLSFSMVMY